MTRSGKAKRPDVRELVLDSDLRMSLQQTQDIAHLPPSEVTRILGEVLGPKFNARLKQDQIDSAPLVLAKGKEILTLLSRYLLTVHLLPIVGERTSVRDHLRLFEAQAQKLHELTDKENYCILTSGLAAGSNFSVAATQVYVVNEALKSTIDAAQKALSVLNSHQLSAAENSRQHLAWELADILESAGTELHTDTNSLFVKILRACVGAVHALPNDDPPEVLRLARNVVSKRKKLNAVRQKDGNTVEGERALPL